MLVLDSGGLSRLSERSSDALRLARSIRAAGHGAPLVPTMVMVESLRGDAGRDANVNRLLKACQIEPRVSDRLARRAAEIRRRAGRGSAVDALVVAVAEPGGTVLTGDEADITAMAANANGVQVMII